MAYSLPKKSKQSRYHIYPILSPILFKDGMRLSSSIGGISLVPLFLRFLRGEVGQAITKSFSNFGENFFLASF